MLKRGLCVLLAAVICLASAGAFAEEETPVMTSEELQQRLDYNPYVNLFDLRSAQAYDAGHIPGAACFPLETLQAMIQEILDDGFSHMTTEITVYGENEEQGMEGGRILHALGFSNVWRLKSIEEWTGNLHTAEDEKRLLGNLDTVDIYGNPQDMSLLAGHPLTMVNVWATYCSPCISEMSALGRLAADMREKGVQIVGLLSDTVDAGVNPVEEQLEKARKIVEDTKADYVHLQPSKTLYWKVLGQISSVPTTFFVDETGLMVGRAYIGARDYDAWKTIIENTLLSLSQQDAGTAENEQ